MIRETEYGRSITLKTGKLRINGTLVGEGEEPSSVKKRTRR